MTAQDVDLVVVGAGMSGIAAARFYLEVHPESRLVILEQDTCPGGVWNARRSYEGFWTQWTVGTAEFSDLRMPRPPDEDLYYDFFKSKHTTEYLENYVDQHRFGGRSLRDRITFEFQVKSIKKQNAVWVVKGDSATFHASKVIVASGLTSNPNMPNLPRENYFDAPIIHQETFGQSSVLSSPNLQKITVVGAGKSSADMVYACVKAGKIVSWIIRASGTGPAFFLSPKGKGPYKNAFEIGSTRIAGTLSPSVLTPDNRWTRFIHRTNLGQKIVNAVWGGADKETREGADFDRRKGALKGFENLKPKAPLFWQNGPGGLLNRTDFWETVAPNVHVFLDDILELDTKLVRLKDGSEIVTDVLLCGTGWNAASFGFFESADLLRLGLPHPLVDDPAEEAALWARLQEQADHEILHKYPILAHPPDHPHKSIRTTPYRLYNGIAPLSDESIAFVGYTLVANYFRGVECQAIWATAYLDKKLKLPSVEDRQAEVARLIAWCKRRYLSNGERGNFVAFESNFYTDKLLLEAGLSSHLKGWFRDYFVPGIAQDMAGLKHEYIAKYGDGNVPVSENK
ncbi:hypothetical protein N7G274_010900 [Stereocaulon virgatum]|uniref:Dimethylaniline monooxygenase n=1 Tax=Stereocaulon virgatum TaxID=373712 RepID=A0ABR3ZV58_9LECA